MVHNSGPGAEALLTLIQSRTHLLQFDTQTLPDIFLQHSLRHRTLRGLTAVGEIPKLHHQQSGSPIFQGAAGGQRSALFEAFRYSSIGLFVG